MSKIRQFQNIRNIFENFGALIQALFSSASRVCVAPEMMHIVFDSYCELSIKEGERIRRAGENSAMDLAFVDESVPISHQLDKF